MRRQNGTSFDLDEKNNYLQLQTNYEHITLPSTMSLIYKSMTSLANFMVFFFIMYILKLLNLIG